jgi:spoIIIJ-associated protein
MEVRVITARTVEEAIELALKELDVDRDEAEVEILSRGKAGFLGIGAEPARVRVTKISGARNPATLAVETVNRILAAAGVDVISTLRATHDPDVGGPIIDLTGNDSGLLIGYRGQTLQSLQFLVNLIVRKKYGDDIRVLLDVERYRERREASLRDMANKVAARVAQSGRSITLEPMSAADRRIIHTSLSNHPNVSTESVGVGDNRKVTVLPKRNQQNAVRPGFREEA